MIIVRLANGSINKNLKLSKVCFKCFLVLILNAAGFHFILIVIRCFHKQICLLINLRIMRIRIA